MLPGLSTPALLALCCVLLVGGGSDVPLDKISDRVSTFREKCQREVMILETPYPWTMENADDYTNIFSGDSVVSGYSATPSGKSSV